MLSPAPQPPFARDFLFQLNAEEKLEVITNCDHLAPLKFAKSLPFAFTEHGALMAATVLSTPQAVAMSVYVVRFHSNARATGKRRYQKEVSNHQSVFRGPRQPSAHDLPVPREAHFFLAQCVLTG